MEKIIKTVGRILINTAWVIIILIVITSLLSQFNLIQIDKELASVLKSIYTLILMGLITCIGLLFGILIDRFINRVE